MNLSILLGNEKLLCCEQLVYKDKKKSMFYNICLRKMGIHVCVECINATLVQSNNRLISSSSTNVAHKKRLSGSMN